MFSINIRLSNPVKSAFTLAEVLITLGIIGVVAVLTIPYLVQKYNNASVESKLKKVYTVMNQAIRMSEMYNGDKQYWVQYLNSKQGLEKYILPYIKYTQVKEDNDSIDGPSVSIYFADGTVLKAFRKWPGQWNFYTIEEQKCKKLDNATGSCRFAFITSDSAHFKAYDIQTYQDNMYNVKYSDPYGCYVNGMGCARLIQYNNWKIPDDYPYKVR